MAHFRRWFRCPPLCQRAGLELAQLLVPAPRDTVRSSQLTRRHFSSDSGRGRDITDRKRALTSVTLLGALCAEDVVIDTHENAAEAMTPTFGLGRTTYISDLSVEQRMSMDRKLRDVT